MKTEKKKLDLDPYEELGLDRTASVEDVKKAFRKRAAQSHPDKGGSARQFALTVLAKNVLSDEERRRKYDQTGQIDDSEPRDSDQQAALELLGELIQSIASGNLFGQGEQFLTMDLPKQMAAVLRSKLDTQIAPAQSANEAHLKRLKKLEKKFKKKKDKKGADLLKAVIGGYINKVQKAIDHNKNVIAVHEKAIEILADYDFERDPAMTTTFVQMTATTGWR